MIWLTTSLILMSRPCATKQLPLTLFFVYSLIVKTAILHWTRYASYAFPYIMLASLFLARLFFLKARILILVMPFL